MNAIEAHDLAVAAGEPVYVDPETGYRVFTSATLAARGRCCGCGCRHCPFQHSNVPIEARADRIQNAAWLTEAKSHARIALSWSGGKDSFLTLRALQRELPGEDIVLFTTFDAETRIVANQEIAISDVVEQAEQLGCGLIGIPLVSGPAYLEQVQAGFALLPSLQTLAFGDLHLEHIRSWREAAFAPLVEGGISLHFPLWQVPYETLMADFVASGARSLISSTTIAEIADLHGQAFGPELVARLPAGVDAFGENGEFHTRIFPMG